MRRRRRITNLFILVEQFAAIAPLPRVLRAESSPLLFRWNENIGQLLLEAFQRARPTGLANGDMGEGSVLQWFVVFERLECVDLEHFGGCGRGTSGGGGDQFEDRGESVVHNIVVEYAHGIEQIEYLRVVLRGK